jgi:hypothetical protein
MPLYDGHQKKLQYDKIAINESSRAGYQTFYQTQYDLHIQQLKADLTDNEQLILQTRKQLITLETLIKVSKQLLNHGELSISDFILTIKNYIDIQGQLSHLEFKALQLTNELNYWNW